MIVSPSSENGYMDAYGVKQSWLRKTNTQHIENLLSLFGFLVLSEWTKPYA